MTHLYAYKGRHIHGLSYDEANGLAAGDPTADEPDQALWRLSAALNEGDEWWDAANAPMSVKRWAAHHRSIGGPIGAISECGFCSSYISAYWLREVLYDNPRSHDQVVSAAMLLVCYRCGWYRTQREHFLTIVALPSIDSEAACLEQSDINASDVPLQELRAHLARHWGDRKHITPSQAEALVADVFREHLDGEVLYTSNGVHSPDGGIDFVIVHSDDGVAAAFQVKRRLTDSPESVTEVRSFLGALALSPFSRGYFVTTAPRFTRAVVEERRKAQSNLAKRNIDLEIVDGTALHRILRSKARRPSFSALDEWVRDYERAGAWVAVQGEGVGQTVSFADIIKE